MSKPDKASDGVASNEAAPASNENIHQLSDFRNADSSASEEVTDRANQESQKELNSGIVMA
jgi:hypothetical protein